MTKKIKVWIKEPFKAPRQEEIEDRLEVYQELVGGYIDCVPIDDGVLAVVSDTGLIDGLPVGGFFPDGPLFGTVILVGEDGEEFADCPLTKEDVWTKYNAFMLMGAL